MENVHSENELNKENVSVTFLSFFFTLGPPHYSIFLRPVVAGCGTVEGNQLLTEKSQV